MPMIMTRSSYLLIAIVFSLFLAVGPEFPSIANAQQINAQSGQTTPVAGKDSGGEVSQKEAPPQASDIKGWSLELEQLEKALSREGIQDQDFKRLHATAVDINGKADLLIKRLAPELKTLRERNAQLGPAPEKGAGEELAEITSQREILSARIAEIDGAIKATQLTMVRSRQIRDGIVETRRTRFVSSVTTKSYTIFDPKMWQPFRSDAAFFARGFPLLMTNIARSFSNSLDATGNRILMVFGALILWIFMLLLASRGINRGKRRINEFKTDRSLKALRSFLNVLSNGFIPALVVLGTVWVLDNFGLFTTNHRVFIFAVSFAIAIAIIITALAYTLIEPRTPERRISVLSDGAAHRVMGVVLIVMLVFVVSWLIYDAGLAMRVSLEFGIAVKAVYALIVAILTAFALRMIRHDNQDGIEMDAGRGLSLFLNWNALKTLAMVGVAIIFLALATGYIALAEFTANQIILTSAVLAFLWLVLEIIDNNIVGCFQPEHQVNQSISKVLGWNHRLTGQVGIVLTGMLRLAAILATVLALLIPWGYRASDWVEWVSAAFFGFKVGDITISVSVILSAIVVFLIGVAVTKALKSWLATRFLPTTRLDVGIRNSISTVFGYVGILVAAMITVSFAGLDLTSLAFVAGALSIGIGFGLQSVVSNFVSGLILLVERPIKAGDWVVTSGGEGTVRKISVRSTEIETFDRATVVVPNATLITDSVVNWNHRSSMGRIRLPLGVGYDSNPERVKEILLECANSNPGILEIPNPIVYFLDFGASSLDFELRCFLADVGNGMSVKSELRYAIFAALDSEGISIPFPQQDVHIKGFVPAGAKVKQDPKPAAKKPSRSQETIVTGPDDE